MATTEDSAPPTPSTEVLPNPVATRDPYPQEDDIKQLLFRVKVALDKNGYGNHPILVNLIAERVLSKNGYDTNLRYGYMLMPNNPRLVYPWMWVETFHDGAKDVTDMVSFGDNSKQIFVLGHSVGFSEACLRPRYFRQVPENTEVLTQEYLDAHRPPEEMAEGEAQSDGQFPTLAQIRREASNVDRFLAKSGERIKNVYNDIVASAKLP